MIKNLTLKFGRSMGAQGETLPVAPVTIFVGPNNSGKSLALREIFTYCKKGRCMANGMILRDIEFEGFPDQEIDSIIDHAVKKPRRGQQVPEDHVVLRLATEERVIRRAELAEILRNINKDNGWKTRFCELFLTFHTLRLDGENRTRLVSQQDAGDLKSDRTTTFQILFNENERRTQLRKILYDAFGQYFVLDPTNLGKLNIRFAQTDPPEDLEKSITAKGIQFHSDATAIEDMSDGVKAFTGMLVEVLAGDPRALIIDEPEAFLHQSLSFKLGSELAKKTRAASKRMFVATHSSNFVLGCIQSGVPISIVRLTYNSGIATARQLDNHEILELMRKPLLRSAGVIAGLFSEFVVVTEAESDRAFYQEINERLLEGKGFEGISNCIFLNGKGKQTVKDIVKPLRKMGIPCVAIVDIDILKEGGTVWTSFIGSGFVPQEDFSTLSQKRKQILEALQAQGWKDSRHGGIELLEGTIRESAENFFDLLRKYGLFVVTRGELESWLPELDVAGHGDPWLVKMFERMGEDPTSSSFIKPAKGDVWDFIGSIRSWLLDPQKKGIPK